MVLAILAIVIAGVMLFYQNASNSQKLSAANSQLAAIQQAVQSMYAGQPTKSGLQNSDIIQALPKSMISGTSGIHHAFNGDVIVASADAGADYTVSFSNVPNDACIRLAASDLGRSLISLTINGAVENPPVAPAEAQAKCGGNNQSTLVWKLF